MARRESWIRTPSDVTCLLAVKAQAVCETSRGVRDASGELDHCGGISEPMPGAIHITGHSCMAPGNRGGQREGGIARGAILPAIGQRLDPGPGGRGASVWASRPVATKRELVARRERRGRQADVTPGERAFQFEFAVTREGRAISSTNRAPGGIRHSANRGICASKVRVTLVFRGTT